MSQKLLYRDQPFQEVLAQNGPASTDPLVVDLGYSVYQGYHDAANSLNVWKGIRFAANAGADNRWQPPKVPDIDRQSTIAATSYGSNCPQTINSSGSPEATGITGDEDCLFLNVAAPANATGLPVLVWIHGGGYGSGYGSIDLSTIIKTNRDKFIGISIQYRLGAFGFLSSEDVMKHGVVNAGILDQIFALQWVQAYVTKFGGDPSQVTIAGQSAGAGSVMLLDMAYGGTFESLLFSKGIAASPYLPTQHYYNSSYPSYQYNKLAQYANCPTYSTETFQCLMKASTKTLQNANSFVSTDTIFGTWAFAPVTDGVLIQDQPATQLQESKLNGLSVLTGNNAIEGFDFVPANITTEADLEAYLRTVYPKLDEDDIQTILSINPGSSTAGDTNAALFATNGVSGPTAIYQSSVATGEQQRLYNIYAEATFVCPSYWLAQAYSSSAGRSGFKYQYSVVPGTHGSDISAYLDPPTRQHPEQFALAMSTAFGNFITRSNPSITSTISGGISSNTSTAARALIRWSPFSNTTSTNSSNNDSDSSNDNTSQTNLLTDPAYPMLNFNTSYLPGAEPSIQVSSGKLSTIYPSSINTGNNISIVNGWTWESGRGARCETWRSLTVKAAGDVHDPLNQTLFPLPPLSTPLGDRTKPGISLRVGVGVGVGLGVPLLILAMVCIWWFKRPKRDVSVATDSKSSGEDAATSKANGSHLTSVNPITSQ